MGKVEYTLPDDLGTLTFGVPAHWVGARADNVDAVWINQAASLFKDNVTLKIRSVNKVANAEQLLDIYINKLAESSGLKPTSPSAKTQGRRSISFDRSLGGHNVTQNTLVMYAETPEKSYLVTLTSSHLTDEKPVDLTPARVH